MRSSRSCCRKIGRSKGWCCAYEGFAGDKQFATTLARGIELLRCFAAGDAMLSNAESETSRSIDFYC